MAVHLHRVGAAHNVVGCHRELGHFDAPRKRQVDYIAGESVDQQGSDHDKDQVHRRAPAPGRQVVNHLDVVDDKLGHCLRSPSVLLFFSFKKVINSSPEFRGEKSFKSVT